MLLIIAFDSVKMIRRRLSEIKSKEKETGPFFLLGTLWSVTLKGVNSSFHFGEDCISVLFCSLLAN